MNCAVCGLPVDLRIGKGPENLALAPASGNGRRMIVHQKCEGEVRVESRPAK